MFDNHCIIIVFFLFSALCRPESKHLRIKSGSIYILFINVQNEHFPAHQFMLTNLFFLYRTSECSIEKPPSLSGSDGFNPR